MKVNKVTPISIVDAIEPALALWCDRLGFQKVAEVPHEGRVGFVLLVRDGHEVMMQTRASLAADVAAVAALDAQHAVYLDVDSIDDAIAATQGATILVPRRKTFYGAEEIWVKDAAGTVVGFAQHVG